MDARPALGRCGEELACRLFERQGYEVVDRNYRCAHGEIDVVAVRGSTVIFCEVKTRRTDRYGLPAEAVSATKQRRLRQLAAAWLADRRPGRVEVRFDVVSVIVRGTRPQVTHIPDAF